MLLFMARRSARPESLRFHDLCPGEVLTRSARVRRGLAPPGRLSVAIFPAVLTFRHFDATIFPPGLPATRPYNTVRAAQVNRPSPFRPPFFLHRFSPTLPSGYSFPSHG